MSKNDITGDEIKTKPGTKNYEAGWDKVFGRIDIIGQNGNEGLHYNEKEDKSDEEKNSCGCG